MTTPLSLTSSRQTGAAARRSLERVSVVSIITSCPIHASGIFPSNSEALGLSLSIIAPSSFRSPQYVRVEQKKAMRRHQEERGCGISNVCYNIGVSLYLVLEVRADVQEGLQLAASTGVMARPGFVARAGDCRLFNRSGFAGPNIFAAQGNLGLLLGATSIDF